MLSGLGLSELRSVGNSFRVQGFLGLLKYRGQQSLQPQAPNPKLRGSIGAVLTPLRAVELGT